MNYTIRNLETRDLAEAAKLLKSMWMEHVDKAPKLLDRKYINKVDVEKYLSKYLDNVETQGFVAVSDNEVVGLATVEIQHFKDMHKFKKLAFFDNLVVRSEYRRHGIADSLIEKRLEWAREKGVSASQSKIYTYNEPAQHLLNKHGFTELYRNYYRFEDNHGK